MSIVFGCVYFLYDKYLEKSLYDWKPVNIGPDDMSGPSGGGSGKLKHLKKYQFAKMRNRQKMI